MKKKILFTAVLAILLTGCEDPEVTSGITSVQMEYSDFGLACDNKTGIVYIDNEIYSGGKSANYYHIYTPYYSKNGRLCRFDDEKIVEVEDKDE